MRKIYRMFVFFSGVKENETPVNTDTHQFEPLTDLHIQTENTGNDCKLRIDCCILCLN